MEGILVGLLLLEGVIALTEVMGAEEHMMVALLSLLSITPKYTRAQRVVRVVLRPNTLYGVVEEAPIPLVVAALASKGVLAAVEGVVLLAAEDITEARQGAIHHRRMVAAEEPHIVCPQVQLHSSPLGHIMEPMVLVEQQQVHLHQAHCR
jgi:hypothetical protein